MNKAFFNLKEILNWQVSDFKEKLSWYIFRVKKYTSNFFYDVFIDGVEDNKIKKLLLEWCFNLEYLHGISINKFSDFFSKIEEIVFPIEISGEPSNLLIKDEAGNEYLLNIYVDDSIFNYVIVKKKYSSETKCVYNITNNGIVLKNLEMHPLDEES